MAEITNAAGAVISGVHSGVDVAGSASGSLSAGGFLTLGNYGTIPATGTMTPTPEAAAGRQRPVVPVLPGMTARASGGQTVAHPQTESSGTGAPGRGVCGRLRLPAWGRGDGGRREGGLRTPAGEGEPGMGRGGMCVVPKAGSPLCTASLRLARDP